MKSLTHLTHLTHLTVATIKNGQNVVQISGTGMQYDATITIWGHPFINPITNAGLMLAFHSPLLVILNEHQGLPGMGW